MIETAPIQVECPGQLALELGDQRATPPEHPLIDLFVVCCQICTGHHPTERCPVRRVCELCTGDHPTSAHAGGAA